MIEYRRVTISEKANLISFINKVLDDLERKEFFIPYTEKELEDIFSQENIITYCAYDNDKIIGMAQLYIGQSDVNELKQLINITSDKVAELGRISSTERIQK